MLAQVLTTIVQAAADDGTGSFVVPLRLDRIENMKKVMDKFDNQASCAVSVSLPRCLQLLCGKAADRKVHTPSNRSLPVPAQQSVRSRKLARLNT